MPNSSAPIAAPTDSQAPSWLDLPEIAFDASLGTARERAAASAAASTLFPTLMPVPTRRKHAEPVPQMDGQADLFGGAA